MSTEKLQQEHKAFKTKAKVAKKAGKTLLADAFKRRADHLWRQLKAAAPKGQKKVAAAS